MNRRDIFKFFGGVAAIPAVKSVEVLTMESDDTLVVSVDGEITDEVCQRLHDDVKAKFPKEQRVMVLSKGLSLSVLRRQK